ncbi:hypothetical protein LZ554_005919 [Drepanopeziza brunnea f. sp. 'monogermtubi']|nr:hypothetical protein LZ554_005919 [Drepanopeziza brunnea f. sp. 'monogermtubi']
MSSRPPTPADLQPFIGQVSPPYFAPFPRLPVELRLAIWQRVEHGSLIIRINIERIIDGLTTYDRFGRASRPYTLKLKSCSTPPAMFHVNSEARNASINMHGYSKALESRLGGKYVWINWIRDAIYIPTPEILQAFCSSLGGALTPNVRDDLHAVVYPFPSSPV